MRHGQWPCDNQGRVTQVTQVAGGGGLGLFTDHIGRVRFTGTWPNDVPEAYSD